MAKHNDMSELNSAKVFLTLIVKNIFKSAFSKQPAKPPCQPPLTAGNNVQPQHHLVKNHLQGTVIPGDFFSTSSQS